MGTMGKWTAVAVAIALCALAAAGCAKREIPSEPQVRPAEQPEPGRNATAAGKARKAEEREKRPGMEGYEIQEKAAGEEARAEERAKKAEELTEKNKQVLTRKIHFDFDSYELDPGARKLLKEKAKILQNHSGVNMVIEGHCDERGTEEYNLALGERRARAAYEFLILMGVSPDRLRIISYGEEKPLVEGHNEAAWAKNRRAEFRIVK
jgi:peptidoglycan-associated lipoprotein